MYSIVLLDRDTSQRDQKLAVVWDTVERISQAKNIKMPEVGYYESAEPNAFATGASKNNMEKGEIEGVVGHEMAHILNGDMVTLTLIQGVLNTFVIVLANLAAKAISSFLTRDDEEGGLGWLAYQ